MNKYLLIGIALGPVLYFANKKYDEYKKNKEIEKAREATTKYGKAYYDEDAGVMVTPTEGGGV